MPTPPSLDSLPRCTDVPPDAPPLEGYTFEGYKNADGSVGTRNLLGITTTVQCVTGVLDHAVKRIRDEVLPRYPNVDDVVALSHDFGCGVAFDTPDVQIPIRTVRNLGRNPNLGGQALVIGLGCEMLQPEQVVTERDAGGSGLDLQEPWLYRLQLAAGMNLHVFTTGAGRLLPPEDRFPEAERASSLKRLLPLATLPCGLSGEAGCPTGAAAQAAPWLQGACSPLGRRSARWSPSCSPGKCSSSTTRS